MKIPFDSLCSNAWLAWNDYSQDQGREKAAKWGRKVGEALEKFARSGAEVRMLLCLKESQNRFGYKGRFEVVVDSLCVLMKTGELELPFSREEREYQNQLGAYGYDWSSPYWRPLSYFRRKYPEIAKDALLLAPDKIKDPWRWPRLSQKYFQCVVSRARGIKLEV